MSQILEGPLRTQKSSELEQSVGNPAPVPPSWTTRVCCESGWPVSSPQWLVTLAPGGSRWSLSPRLGVRASTLAQLGTGVSWEPVGCCITVCSSLHKRNGSTLLAQMVKNLPAIQETQVRSLGWEDPLEKGMATHSSILAWRIL